MAVPMASMEIDFGPFETAAEKFEEIIKPWLASLENVILRLAFGAILVYPAEDRNEAYQILGRYVPSIRVDPDATRELLYRVNRPKILADGMELNRITNWSAVAFRMAVLNASTTAQLAERDFARLEIDNSTSVVSSTPLERAQVPHILRELVALGLENAAHGEVP